MKLSQLPKPARERIWRILLNLPGDWLVSEIDLELGQRGTTYIAQVVDGAGATVSEISVWVSREELENAQ